ncbi:MAG: AAA family ATPase [Gemmataceae bacterium]
MSTVITEKDLPAQLDLSQAVEAAYASDLAVVGEKLTRGLPALVECDKELVPFLFANLRDRLKPTGLKFAYLDGRRAEQAAAQGPMPVGLMGATLSQLRNEVRGAVERKVLALPHLDLLTTSEGGLTSEAREVVALLYENPEVVWLGFKDPTFPLPKVIENLFPYRTSLLGVARPRLRYLVTQKESRKFGREFNPWALYKHVSGVNAVRLRRLLATLEGEDYPADPKRAFRQLRQATLVGSLEVPDVDFDRDIGGYRKVKTRLRQEILDVLAMKDRSSEAEEVARLEELLPRGMIFWGPPGTGKTYFAKAMAAAIGAAVTVVSGPELKSRWVGKSEENLRQIFHRARQSAPAIIVFDELDSFATARGTYTGSGVEHSMVNQLLTEMDGFHKEELVFVVGTTNFVESLDPALLRPGRFEFHIHVPYPDDEDRRAIFEIYDRKMRLQMSPEALDYAVKRTGPMYVTATGTPSSGDHLNALCRSVARLRLREKVAGPTTPELIERGLTEYDEKLDFTPKEERLMATHEAGHAVVSLNCEHSRAIERITIRSEMSWAPAYVMYQDDKSRRIGETRNQMLDDLCVLLGGIEAERLLIGDVSTGAGGSDLIRATHVAHLVIEALGMGGPETGVRQYRNLRNNERFPNLSEEQKASLDRAVSALIEECRVKAAAILRDNRPALESLRDELLEKKTIDAKGLGDLRPKVTPVA